MMIRRIVCAYYLSKCSIENQNSFDRSLMDIFFPRLGTSSTMGSPTGPITGSITVWLTSGDCNGLD